MKNIRVLAIAPYEGLGTLIETVVSEMEMLDVTVRVGDLEEGVQELQKLRDEEFEIIVSRGGTSSLIEKFTTVPVVNIAVSGYDCVRAVKLAELNSNKVAFVGFSNITQSASITCELLKSPVGIFTINHEAEVDEVLQNVVNEGYGVVIGDVVTITKAKQKGMQGILLTSGRESVVQALDEARRIVPLLRGGQRRELLLNSALKESGNCLMVVSEKGECLFSSSREIDEKSRSDLSEMISLAWSGKSGERIVKLGRRTYKLEVTPLNIDYHEEKFAIAYLWPLSNSPSFPASITTKNAIDNPEIMSYATFGNSPTMGKTLEAINTLRNFSTSVLIEGERGTGKDSLAYSIHMNSRFQSCLFITVDCELMTLGDFQYLVDIGNQILTTGNGSTVYFRHINRLSEELQRKLVQMLLSNPMLRMISSSPISLVRLVRSNLFYEPLYKIISQAPIQLNPLRERAEDISSLSSLIIAEANSKFGKQVIGFEDAAREILGDYSWPYNIEELRAVIDRAVILTDGSYISACALSDVLKSVQIDNQSAQMVSIDSKTLRDLESEIINAVLRDENMNQNKAAKRLGMSRSTLWRKLKIVNT